MAVYNDKSSLLQRLIQLVRSGGAGGKTTAKNVRDMFTDVIDTLFAKINSAAEVDTDLAWVFNEEYNLTDNQFAVYQLRLFKSKIAVNIGNAPPTVADVDGIYQDEYWLEVSPAPKSGISEWQAGTYGNGLVIVYKDDKLYRLTVVARPYQSSDFVTEEIAGKWVAISGATQGPDPSPTAGTSQLHYSLFSDLDTIGAEVSLQGKIVVDSVIRSSKIVAHSYMVKLDTSSTFTAQADIAALNAWIDAQVSQPTTIWQFYPVADFGSNQGAGSLTINYHV